MPLHIRQRIPPKLNALWRGSYARLLAASAVPLSGGQKRVLFQPEDPKADTVYIMGPIMDADDEWMMDWFGATYYTTAEHVRSQMKGVGERLQLRVNSPGGSVNAGAAIRLQLQEYVLSGGRIDALIEGMDASASTLATEVASRIEIADMGSRFIHPVRVGVDVYGYYTADELRAIGPELEQQAAHADADNAMLSRIYANRTGESPEAMAALMEQERWLGAEEAVERGFADAIFASE